MTAIRPTDSALREKIEADLYNQILNDINAQYAEMDKYIGNLESDITSVKEFIGDVLADQARGYDIGTSLDTLHFQHDSLKIDNDFFKHMKEVYIKKLYGDLYTYCDGIIESAMSIEDMPAGFTREKLKERKFRNMPGYPAPQVPNPAHIDPSTGLPVEGEPATVPDPSVRYDMNEVFALINCTTSNLRELAEDIGSFDAKIARAREREARGFAVGNLIMNLEGQKQKLMLEFASYVIRLKKFLQQNQGFAARCLKRIQMISSEIVTAEELARQQSEEEGADDGGDAEAPGA